MKDGNDNRGPVAGEQGSPSVPVQRMPRVENRGLHVFNRAEVTAHVQMQQVTTRRPG